MVNFIYPAGGRCFARALAALVAVALSTAVHARPPVKETFPRLAGYQISATPFDGFTDPDYLRAMARLDLVILGGSSQTSAAEAIKKINPNVLVGKYTVLVDIWKNSNSHAPLRQKVDSEAGPNSTNARDWWARDSAGEKTSTWPGTWTPNHTEFVKPDENGDRWPEWKAKYDHAKWIKETPWDFWFSDAVFWRPRKPEGGVYPDWAGDRPLTSTELQSAYRRGHRAHWDQIKKLTPDKLIIVNHDWYRSEDVLGGWKLPEYDKQVHGGMLERIMQESMYQDEKRHPWERVMTYYRRSMNYMLEPKLIVFIAQGSPTNYRFFRYAFATCLMGNGYFKFAPMKYHYGTVEWFDEFDLSGTEDTGWLGRALSPPPASAWKNGVWRRDFEGGIALVNPLGNGRRTVSIEAGFRRIDGRQDPAINDGSAASLITLAEGDGLVLVRESRGGESRPHSPGLAVEP